MENELMSLIGTGVTIATFVMILTNAVKSTGHIKKNWIVPIAILIGLAFAFLVAPMFELGFSGIIIVGVIAGGYAMNLYDGTKAKPVIYEESYEIETPDVKLVEIEEPF